MTILARYVSELSNIIIVVLGPDDVLGPISGPGEFYVPTSDDNTAYRALKDKVDAGEITIAAPVGLTPVIDVQTLSDWRVGLLLWGRLDEVRQAIHALKATGSAMALVAEERLEYANHIYRDELMQLRGVFGFSEAEVEESLARADRVRQGDLSGVYPPVT